MRLSSDVTHRDDARCKNPNMTAPRYPPAPKIATFFFSNGLAAQPLGRVRCMAEKALRWMMPRDGCCCMMTSAPALPGNAVNNVMTVRRVRVGTMMRSRKSSGGARTMGVDSRV
jgi:hypothetical protein